MNSACLPDIVSVRLYSVESSKYTWDWLRQCFTENAEIHESVSELYPFQRTRYSRMQCRTLFLNILSRVGRARRDVYGI
jgi:hypothetical protein